MKFRPDPARERGWVLTSQGVFLLDLKKHRTGAFVDLPEWTWIKEEFSCAPDFALGPAGEVLVSSNVMPTLWRVDPVTLRVTRHDLALDQDRERDIGFSQITYSRKQGAYFAVSEQHGSVWKIDPSLKTAQKVSSSAPSASCGD